MRIVLVLERRMSRNARLAANYITRTSHSTINGTLHPSSLPSLATPLVDDTINYVTGDVSLAGRLSMPPGPAHLKPSDRSLLRSGYPLLVGMLASWTVLLLKCAGEVVKNGAGSDLNRWQLWMFPLGLAITLPTQLFFLNRALRHFESLYVVPALQSFWSTSSIVMGGMFFQEFDRYTTGMVLSFGFGVCFCGAGLVILTRQHHSARGCSMDSHGNVGNGPAPGVFDDSSAVRVGFGDKRSGVADEDVLNPNSSSARDAG
eukprot:CAMPEP_0181238126 /NCGR_PEP_ID=MMETSP1096-20121128/39164_1 /TAXON_ID=156174 ORGANISM="Chrysochromulina ericina, Strain CCMP281" /NCGR_SAMPLE_ID=MMETSP1096 /ASSEMBLY_ACC=CAM_ASM_000453 /LENGTH=259 /DNA_ID=CAMNT_0023333595 /DNA_START=163 /DNA_END=942 /DNA_ORIENTATION=-